MSVVPKSQKLAAIENTISSMYQGARQGIINNGDRVLTSVMGTFGEASVESLQSANEYRDKLIQDYRNTYGVDPTGQDLVDINESANKVGNYVWGMNTLILTGTNYIQLPKILGSSRKVEKAFINDITQKGIGQEFIESLPKTRFGRISSTAFRGVGRMFVVPEGIEEGLQFASAVGVSDYFNRAYYNREDLSDFLKTTYNVMGNVLGEGIEETISSKEGMESILIGMLSGGIQQAPMTIYTEGFTGRGGVKGKNTAIALKELNEANIQNSLVDQTKFLSIGIGSQVMRQKAIENNDILSEKDYEADYALSYLMPRAKYGKMDSVYDELNYYKEQANNPEGFAELKTQGVAFEKETSSQFIQRISNLENTAKAVEKHYDNINETYSGVFATDEDGQTIKDSKGRPIRKFSPVVIDKLVYAASKIDDYSIRIPNLTNTLLQAGINTSTVLNEILESNAPRTETLKESIDQINSMQVNDDVKNDLKRSLSDLVEMSLRRKSFIEEYNNIKNNPELYSIFSNAEVLRKKGPIDVTQKEGRKTVSKTLEVGKEYSLAEPIRLENGKLVLAPKLTIISETLGGEFEVRLPDGREMFLSPMEFKTYSISEEENASQELEDILNTAIDDVLNYPSVKDIVEKPEQGTNKLDYINSLNDNRINKLVLNRFNRLAKDYLEEQNNIRKINESLVQSKNDLDKQQNEIADDSVEIDEFSDNVGNERISTGETGPLKSAVDFFDSTITESEDPKYGKDLSKSSPHIRRSRIFLNNFRKLKNKNKLRAIVFTYRQEKDLGLSGITALSYKKTQEQIDSDPTAFEAQVTDVDNGFVGVVFVEISGKKQYFVDENGQRIGEVGKQVDLGKVIFQTMPTTSVEYSEGSDRYREGEEADFKRFSEVWRNRRSELMKSSTVPPVLEFRVSKGFPVTQKVDGVFKKNPVGKVLVSEEAIATIPGLISVTTTKTVTHNGKILNVKKGHVIIQDGEIIQYLNNNKLGKQKATTVYQLIKSIVTNLEKDVREGRNPKFESNKLLFLKNVLNYKSTKDKKDNQLWFNIDDLTVSIGKKSYKFSELASQESDIINQISEMYHSANAKTLRDDVGKTFFEYYFKDGKLEEREWSNYQSYLVSGENRSTEDIPFVTIASPTTDQPYPFAGKYATLVNFELGQEGYLPGAEEKEVPKKTSKDKSNSPSEVIEEEEPIIAGEFKINKPGDKNKVVNTITYKAGEFKFYAIMLPDGSIEIDSISPETNLEFFENLSKNEGIISITRKMYPSTLKDAESVDVAAVFAIGDAIKKIEAVLPKEQSGEEIKTEEPAETKAEPVKTEEEKLPTSKKKGGLFGKLKSGVEDPETRKLRSDEKGDRTDQRDIEAFKAWHKANVPNIPFEVLENIISLHDGSKAWGVFEQGVAKFFKRGLRGTEYHEVFEGIWKAFLTEGERQAILDEFKSKRGEFTDRETGRLIQYNQATDRQAKERIADDFADYRIGKLPARSVSERIRNFFKSIVEFFKTFVAKPTLKDDLFKAIDSGKFKDYVVPNAVKSAAPEYRKLTFPDGELLSEDEAYSIVQDMTITMAEYIFNRSNDNALDKLYSSESATGKEIYNHLRNKYSNNIEILGEELFEELFLRSKDLIRTIGVNFNVDGVLTVNGEERTSRLYSPEAFEVDFKKNARFAVKFALATNPATEVRYNKGSVPKFLTSNGKPSGFKLLNNFNKTFANLLNKLSNTSLQKIDKKLIDLIREDGNYYRLFARLGGDANNGILDYSSFKDADWTFYIQFIQSFAKSNPFVEMSVVKEINGKVTSYNAPGDRTSALNKVRNEWFENIKELSKNESSFIKTTLGEEGRKLYVIDNKQEYYPSEKGLLEPKVLQTYLKNIGVEFSLEDIEKINRDPKLKKSFDNAVSRIYEFGPSGFAESRNKFSKVDSHVRTLADLYVRVTNPDQDTTRFNIKNERTGNFSDSNAPSVFESEFNESMTIDELLEARPELKDTFSKNSILIKKGGLFYDKDGNKIDGKSLRIGVIDGVKDEINDDGISVSQLTKGDRFTVEINQNLKGRYYILIPADSATERMIELGVVIDYDLFNEDGNRAFSKIYQTFKGYLEDEIDLALDWENRSKLEATRNNAKELRFFKDILDSSLVNKIHSAIEEGKSKEEILKIVNDDNQLFESSIRNTLININENVKKDLINSGEINVVNLGNNQFAYSYPKLDSNFAEDNGINTEFISEDELSQILSFVNMNYMVANIEMHKTIFGDPYQFKIKNGKLEETKRVKSWLSPRRITVDYPELNTYLNTNYNNPTETLSLPAKDMFRYTFKSFVKTVTLSDVKPFSRFIEDFGGYDESDGFSIILDGAYREVKLKNGEWNRKNTSEEWFQWNQSYARQKLSEKGIYKYTNESLKKHDAATIAKPQPGFVTEVLKPIVSGSKYGVDRIEGVIDKFSQMPITYKMVEGTNLENLYVQMLKEKVGYVVYKSARKEGARNLHSVYDASGNFNTSKFSDNTIENISWKSYGIQLENSYEEGKSQTRGSQLTKNDTIDMFDNGEVVPGMERAKELADEKVKVFKEMHENAFGEFLEKLGLTNLNGSYAITDPVKISKELEYELLRRQVSQNVIDTIRLDSNGQFTMPFEASPAYEEIRSILISMVNKSLISPSMSGKAHVQVPATMWENASEGRKLLRKIGKKYVEISREQFNALSEKDKGSVVLASDKLKFYEDIDGKRYMEIMIPNFWKKYFTDKSKFPNDNAVLEYLNRPENQKILFGIGFRIPHQAMSSTEVFKIGGFLDESMGSTVVVPSEIVKKAGSDFDIDKLNMYLKSVYVDQNGDVKLVEYKGSKEETIKFYEKVYEETIQKKLDKISKGDEFRDKVLEIFEIAETIENPESVTGEGLEFLFGKELFDFYVNNRDVISEIEEQALSLGIKPADYIGDQMGKLADRFEKLSIKKIDNDLKNGYVKRLYKKSLENKYYDVLEELISLPGNFKRLLSPLDDAGLAKVADELDEIRGEKESDLKNKLLSRSFMSSLRHSFLMAKKWVGIAAVNITGHSIGQKVGLYFDSNLIDNLSDYDKAVLGDLNISIPHNSVTVGNKQMISLGSLKTADGNDLYISDRLSGYATAFVDVANDPYILKIIKSDVVVGTAMLMERIGVGNITPYFLAQPIISEYLNYLDKNKSRSLFGKDNRDYISSRYPIGKNDSYNLSNEFVRNEDGTLDFDKSKSNLIKMIELGNDQSLTESEQLEFNVKQRAVFNEFLKLAKLAQLNFKFSQAYNYDTTRVRNYEGFKRKMRRTEVARKSNIVSSIDKVMNETFIGDQVKLIREELKALGSIMKLDSEELEMYMDNIMDPFYNDEYMSQDDFDYIAKKLKTSFLDYVIQTKSDQIVSSDYIELFTGKNSVASQLLKLRKKYPKLEILKLLTPTSSLQSEGAVTVSLKVIPTDAIDINRHIGMMYELKELEPSFYNDLIKLSVLQGTASTNLSISNIIPLEDRAKIIAPVIETLRASEELNGFDREGMFYRNNFKDERIVPEIKPRYKYAIRESVDGISIDYSKVDTFVTMLTYGIKPGNAKIISLNNKYSFMNEADKDFVKMRRYQYVSGETSTRVIDITNASKIMTVKEFNRLVEQGKLSRYEIIGYKKVKSRDGVPFTIQKKSGKSMDDFSIYKMVNLYGDGKIVAEYPKLTTPSVFDNNTFKVEQEMSDDDIIKILSGEVIETPTETELSPLTFPQTVEDVELEVETQEQIEVKEEVEDPEVETKETEPKVDNFKYFGKMYEIQLDENNNPIDVIGYKGKDANKQKLLEAYAENPNVDPQNNKPFREELEESTEGNSFKFEDGTVINTGSISLNEQQKEALQLAVNAIKKGQTKFVLRGYAGTGKSTISKFIREYLQQSNTFKDVKYSSPTHKANTNLLIQLIRGKVFGTLPTTTAKLLNKRKGENGKFIPGPKDQMPYNGVLIIDESSMIDSEDYNMLIDLAKRKSTTIVFMGDPAQLPPVGQKQLSKALQYESSAEGVELTQVMRQQGDNPLLDILTNIRQNLSSIVEKFNFRNKINGKGEGVQFTKSYDEFNNRIIEYFSSNEYKEDPTYAKILTYTNASVANYNNMIQAQLGLSPYAEGSILMGYEQVSEGSSINNGQDYIVLENEYVTNRPVTVFNGNVGNKSFNIQSNVSGYNVKLRRVFSKEDEQLLKDNKQEALLKPVEVFIINPSDDRNINFMEKVLAFKKVLNDNTISWRLRQDPLNELENFFNRYQLPADIISYKGNITTLPKLKEENPQLFKINKVTGKSEFEETANVDKPMLNKNIDYGYAVTSHKAQGSTYKYIFVDYENMENPANDKSILDNGVKYAVERQQLKYVGLSRASKVAIVFSRKAEEKLLDSKEEISNVPEIEESFVPSYEISESTDSSEEYYLEIKSFYNTLTPEQKIKVGSLDGLIFQYEMIPFDINEEQFVESIKCKL